MKSAPRSSDKARGGVLLEFALLWPLLLLLALPPLDYARAILAQIELNEVSRTLAARLSRETSSLPLPQRLQQALASARADGAWPSCVVATQLVGAAAGTQVGAQALSGRCPIDAARHAASARQSLARLGLGQEAYVVEAFDTQTPIFLRGVLSVAAPPERVYARAVF